MRRALRRLSTVALLWRSPPARVTKITVWHHMTVIATITDAATVATFAVIWSQKIKQPKGLRTRFQYSFDVQIRRGTKSSSTRWVYNSQGFAKVMVIPDLGFFRNPLYRIPSADELNRLVGIDERVVEPCQVHRLCDTQ